MIGILRGFWQRYFRYGWRFGVALIFILGIPRFIIVLHSYQTRSYMWVMVYFLTLWFLPWIFLTLKGRRYIGIVPPVGFMRLLVAFIAGSISCLCVIIVFNLLFGNGMENAFHYIAGNNAASGLTQNRGLYFLIAVIPSMIFSPIGEELLYRGLIHGSFVSKYGDNRASIIDSLAFGLTHLAHFGIVFIAGKWEFLPVAACVWVISMFFTCRVFYGCKLLTNSIYGAILAHSGFNFMMMYYIFYYIL